MGTIVGFACSPLTNWLEDRRVPRGAAALLSLVVVLAAIVALVALFVGPFLRELTVLLRNVPSYFTQLQDALETFWATFGSSSGTNVQNAVNTVVERARRCGHPGGLRPRAAALDGSHRRASRTSRATS